MRPCASVAGTRCTRCVPDSHFRSEYAADDFLIAAVLARTLAQHFDSPAFGFGVAGIHAKEIARKNGSLIAARAGAHFQENVVVVVRVFGNQKTLQLEFLAQDARGQIRELFLAHRSGRRIFIGGQFLGSGGIALECEEASIATHEIFQARVFHGEFAELILLGNDARIGQKPADFLKAFIEFFQLAPDGIFHGREL